MNLLLTNYVFLGLRKLILSKSAILKFIGLASANTRKGIETCGILSGTITKTGLFVVTYVVIPNLIWN